jgi:hypothetical protein
MVLSQALYLLKECFAEALNKQAKGYANESSNTSSTHNYLSTT